MGPTTDPSPPREHPALTMIRSRCPLPPVADVTERVVESITAPPDPAIEVVCPFCGRGYGEPRDSCDACGGLPVVSPDDRQVYETVLASCGPAGNPVDEPDGKTR